MPKVCETNNQSAQQFFQKEKKKVAICRTKEKQRLETKCKGEATKFGKQRAFLLKGTYSRELVTSVADEHASLPNSSISHCHTFYEF